MHILLFGATEVGYMIASRMYLEHDITLIDDHTIPEKFNSLDISFIHGGGTDIDVLTRANASKADFFVACSGLDEANIVACWTVKKIADLETVCFVSKEEIYANLISSVKDQYQTKYDIDTLIWPEQLLTQDIFRIVMVPEAIDVEYFDEGQAKLFEYPIKEGSPLCSIQVSQYDFPEDVLIVAIHRNNELFIPSGNTTIEVGDRAIFMGTGPALDLLAAKVFPSRNKIRSAAVIGGGNVGFFLAQKMEQAKIKVKIIENDENRCVLLANTLKSSLVLHADGTDLAVLEEESIGKMDVIVCVTNNDEKNLLCSLLVKQLGASRVVTRVENIHNAQLFDKVGIDVVVSPWESAMKELFNHFKVKEVDTLALVERGKGEVVHIVVPKTFGEKKVMDLKLPTGAIIGMVHRHRKYLIPGGATTIYPNDKLKIFTTAENKDAIISVFAQ